MQWELGNGKWEVRNVKRQWNGGCGQREVGNRLWAVGDSHGAEGSRPRELGSGLMVVRIGKLEVGND